jgi:hypothetical protein
MSDINQPTVMSEMRSDLTAAKRPDEGVETSLVGDSISHRGFCDILLDNFNMLMWVQFQICLLPKQLRNSPLPIRVTGW